MTTNATDSAAKPYTVTRWGSNPDETDNDDCWTGDDFATREEALTEYRSVVNHPDDNQLVKVCGGDWEFVMIDGPDVHEVMANPDQISQRRHRRERAASDREWQREIANEAGMRGGCDAYNEAMGY